MRRVLEEISDDEWDHHGFKPSRILKKAKPSPPPPIESFAYRGKDPKPAASSAVVNLSDEDDWSVEKEDVDDDDWDLSGDDETAAAAEEEEEEEEAVNLDDDLDEEQPAALERFLPPRITRGRRFVIDEDSDFENGTFEIEDDDDDEEEFGIEEKGNDRGEEFDVVGKALRKCAKISAELRKELYGSSSVSAERYAEVEASSTRIVTQEDVDAACATEDSDFEPTLKPYQLVGVNFLLLLYRKNIGGAILADEMGLGKTVQAVTYLTLLKHLDNDSGPHLIVCPASVLENWERELKRWCPSFTVILFHGAGRNIYSKELSSLGKAGLPPPFNVLLVCYSLFERRSAQQKDDRKVLKRWQWSTVLMDEAHVMKDKNSYRWKNLMSVAKNASQRLMLTGTPLQNDLHELWSLLEFMMPDIFATGNVDLKKLLNAEDSDLISRIKSILGPFILRRLKSDVMQQLVPKIQNVQYVMMGREQCEAYKDAIDEYRTASRARFMKSSAGSSSNSVNFLPKRQISNYFTQFRKIANHPLLVRRIYTDDDVVRIARMLYPKGTFGFECGLEKAIQELKTYNDFSIHRLLVLYGDTGSKGALTDEHVLGSAKCQALAELLPLLSNGGHRVLIFSQWTQMLDILEWTLEVIGVTYKRLDGSTQVTERQTIVDTFNSDPSIFACLLSTRAGGQGLNLIGADTVIIHDMDFNPQMDRQAEDRCHRIGQNKPVTIYRLVTKDTVDENIYEIARRKLILDAAVLESGAELNDIATQTQSLITPMAASLFLLLLLSLLSISAVHSSSSSLHHVISSLGLPSSSPCLIPGVTCVADAAATRIRLPSRRLNGTIPASIGRLSSLRHLSLPNNLLRGPLPSEISSCSKLETLDLRNNRLSGEVPLEISSLVRLRALDLSSNSFSGDLSFLIHFPNLENLSLADNFFSGRIPLSLSSFRNLVFLDLSGNSDLHGDVPPLRRSLLTSNSSKNQTRTRGHVVAAPAPSPLPTHGNNKKNKHKVTYWIIGFVAGSLAGIVSGLFCSVVFRMILNCILGRYKKTNTSGPSIFSSIIKNAKELSFLEQDDALASLEVIGRGGCGEVYKAELPSNPGKVIAIKRIKKIPDSGEPTDEETRLLDKWMRQIRSEIMTVGKIRHRNLLPLLAHVTRPDCHFLIYEYMKNGSVHDAIKRVSEGTAELDWDARLKIARGIANGLEYLHIYHKTHIIHRDLKPANILLDDDMEARIADFGLAKEMPDANTHMTTSNVAGTAGYIAPEYHQILKFTTKCDIYSFGVILAVLVTGKFPSDDFFQDTDEMSLVKWLRNVMSSANPSRAIDPKLMGNGNEEQMLLVLRIACFCTVDEPRDRPNSKDVRLMLSQLSQVQQQ